ncbi:MAG: methionyl-tRNA formyltransferase [Flavobacteriales bacterium]|nr:methionyl-tRNA formyltransferase [Flavobacteriales bacterium]
MTRPLRIVFMGTPGFAVESLKVIHGSNHNVVGVITAPDRPAGRGRKLQASEVKAYAKEHDLLILQPEKLRDSEFLNELKSLNADLFVVVAFRMLPELVWSMPPLGTINLHASLLPQYRGAAPINWAIINGETKTGATTFYIDAEIDKGKTIDTIEVDINPEDDARDLHDRLMHYGAQLLLKTIDMISEGKAVSSEQSESDSTLKKAPKLNPENRKIDWTRSANETHNLIRGLSPYPSAYTHLVEPDLEKKSCKIYRTTISETQLLEEGQIETDNKSYLKVGTATKDLFIETLQLSGKKKMGIKDLLNGYSFVKGAIFR